ncbi:MAG: trypsin-like serine protease [Polyangiaceae bacterium]|jgi:hypothetical protein|nr:trypsin-like serine protease [Polyangiaceae bacterium]
MRVSKYLKATGAIVLATTVCACVTSSEAVTGEEAAATGKKQDPLWSQKAADGGVYVPNNNDEDNPDSNMVVAILKQGPNEVACTGALMTPTKVLTTAHCASTLCQDNPRVAVGAVKSSWKIVNSADVQKNVGYDLAMITLDEPVLDRAKAARERLTLKEPTPESRYNVNANVWSYRLAAAGTAGWSPLNQEGQVNPTYAQNRQMEWRSEGWLVFRREATPGYWHMPAYGPSAIPETGLGSGDWGAPLFAQDLNGSAERLIGIASAIAPKTFQAGQSPPNPSWDFPSCTTTDFSTGQPQVVWICDSYIDLTQPAVRDWVFDTLKGMPTDPAWVASHPRLDGYDWWLGEVDYIGPCDASEDADCDHWYNANDNCPGMQNYDQKDTDKDGLGDVCDKAPTTPRVQPRTEIAPIDKKFEVGTARMSVRANHKFRTFGKQTGRGAGVLFGHTQAMYCECPGSKEVCIDDKSSSCWVFDGTPRGKNWKSMTIASSTLKQPVTGTVEANFGDTSNGGEGYQDEWTWNYWTDLKPPARTATEQEQTFSVLNGWVWTWAKNFGTTRPDDPNLISEVAWSESRTQLQRVQVVEVVPPLLRIPREPIHVELIPWEFPPPYCPNCGPDSVLRLDRITSPTPLSILGSHGQSTPESALASPTFRSSGGGMMVRSFTPTEPTAADNGLTPAIRAALDSGVRRSLVAATDSGRKTAGAPVLAVVDPDSHAVMEAYAYSKEASYLATVARVPAPAYAAGTQLAAALRADGGELSFFGENLSGEAGVPRIRSVNLRTGRTTEASVKGLDRSTQVLAAAYSGADSAYYLLDIGLEATGARVVGLVSITAKTKQASVLATWPLTGAYSSYELTVGTGNVIAITAEGDAGHAIVLTSLGSWGTARVLGVLFGTDHLAMPALVTDRGLSLVYADGQNVVPTLTPSRLRYARPGSTVQRETVGSASQAHEVF